MPVSELPQDSIFGLRRELQPDEIPIAVDAFRQAFLDDDRFVVTYATTSFSIKIAGGPVNKQLTALVVVRYGSAYIGWLADQIAAEGLPPELATSYTSDITAITGATPHPTRSGSWAKPVEASVLVPALGSIRERTRRLADDVYEALEAAVDDMPKG